MKLLEHKFYNFLKENLAVIIIIPTFLGGIWQLVELARISISFIRFFSVSQLVPDGLLISFFIGVLYLGYKLLNLKRKNEDDDMEDDGMFDILFSPAGAGKPSKSLVIVSLILLSITSFMLFFGIYPELSKIYKNKAISGMSIFMLPLSILLIGMGVKSIVVVIRYIILQYNIKIHELVTYFLQRLFGVIIFWFMIMSISVVANIFHETFVFQKELKNSEYLDEKIKSSNREIISYKTLYFNDKYIFVQYEFMDGNSKIEVFKFDTFFVNKTDSDQ